MSNTERVAQQIQVLLLITFIITKPLGTFCVNIGSLQQFP